MLKKILTLLAVLVGAVSEAAPLDLNTTLYNEGLYYRATGELHAELIASQGEKYRGKINVPNFFNVTSVDADGKTVINSYFVSAVADGAFDGCGDVTSVIFNGTTIKFGANAFRGCSSLRAMDFPSSFAADTEIGESAFEGCTALGEITFGNRVGPIPAKAFAGCSGLTEITIAATEPPALAADAFDAATMTKCTVYVPKSALAAYKAAEGWKNFKTIVAISEYSFMDNGIYYKIDELNSKRCYVTLDGYGSYSGDVVIPEFVLYNGITYTVSEIGRDAFRGCGSLTSVTLPESIANLGINAFQGCTALESITLPEAISTLPDELFRDCTALKNFTCPPRLGRIAKEVFRGCTALETVTFSPDVYIIGAYAFADCVSLKVFQAPEKMNLIGDYAFQNCTSLEEIKGTPTWDYWYANGSFADCDNIRYIHIPVAEPPRCPKESMFTKAVYDNATLVVPEGSVEAYATSTHGDANTPDVWQKFQHIAGSQSGLTAIEADLTEAEVAYFNLQGIPVASPEKGKLYIKVKAGTATKLIY